MERELALMSLTLSFNMSFSYYFNFKLKDKVRERKVRFVATSLAQSIYFETRSMQIQCTVNKT